MVKKTALLSLSALAAATALATSTPADACGTEAYIGQVCVIAGAYCPKSTVEANGQMLSINNYNSLYALLGCTFGGDCRTTFGLPDLRGRVPVQYGQGTDLASHPFAKAFGQEAVGQTIAMMGTHTHSATATGSSGSPAKLSARQVDGGTNIPQSGYMLAQGVNGLDPNNTYVNPTASPGTDVALGGVSGGGTAGTIVIGIAGASMAMPTVPPSLAMRYCIVLEGLFPPRP